MTELMVLPSDKKGIEQVFIEGQDIDSTITRIREEAKILTIVRKKEGFVERPLWICTFCTAEGKEQMVAISLKELCQMITHRKKGEVA